MRILILGNMANTGYAVTKGLWKIANKDHDIDLAVNISDSFMSSPEWEKEDHNESEKIKDNFEQNNIGKHKHNKIRYFDFLNNALRKKEFVKKIKSRYNLIKMIREYDIVEAHVPYVIYSQFSMIPYVAYDEGWIRYFPYQKGLQSKLVRRGYRKAKSIIITNPDTLEISDSLPYLKKERIFFIPNAIDTQQYRPLEPSKIRTLRSEYISNQFAKEENKKNEDDLLILFSPARHDWKEKGNDKMITAFSKFVNIFPKCVLILVDWGFDVHKSKQLIAEMGLSSPTNYIEWLKPVPKNQLIQYYNIADIVLDQFVLGSMGLSTLEPMSCQKPVLVFYKKNYIVRAFGEECLPPVLNSFSHEDIYCNLIKIAHDKDLRIKIGRQSRDWIIKTHSLEVVASKHLELFLKIIS